MDLEIISIDKAYLCAFHDNDLHINCPHRCMVLLMHWLCLEVKQEDNISIDN